MDNTIDTLTEHLDAKDLQLQEPDDQITQLTEAVAALAAQQGKPDAPAGLDQALAKLAQGHTEQAQAIFRSILDTKATESQAANLEAAPAARHLGALAFLSDTTKALEAYRRATELEPGNANGWNQLGQLQARVGDLPAAENAFREVLKLGDVSSDKHALAIAYGNLGSLYQIRGKLDQAMAMYTKALAIDEKLGRQQGMAIDYGNLRHDRGELDQAEAMYKKSLTISQEVGAIPKAEKAQKLLDGLHK